MPTISVKPDFKSVGLPVPENPAQTLIDSVYVIVGLANPKGLNFQQHCALFDAIGEIRACSLDSLDATISDEAMKLIQDSLLNAIVPADSNSILNLLYRTFKLRP